MISGQDLPANHSLIFTRRQMSALLSLYSLCVSVNMFRDYSFEFSPTAGWQRINFKRHVHAAPDVWVQAERSGPGYLYTLFDSEWGNVRRSGKFDSLHHQLRKALAARAPALHRGRFAPEEDSLPTFSVIDGAL